jgi:Na+-driven multidrug efflux pump
LIGTIFTDEEEILDLFDEIKFPLALWMASMNLAVANEIILQNCGRGNVVLFLGLIGSWVG